MGRDGRARLIIPYLRSRRGQRIARVRFSGGENQVCLFWVLRYAGETDIDYEEDDKEDDDDDDDDLNSFIAALVDVENVEELERAMADIQV